tara:strand:+ start:14282 stop:14554 length:273 start_codon:yes stop_codon:yes gene_type:complete
MKNSNSNRNEFCDQLRRATKGQSTRRAEAISFYSDFHKDARGFRPRNFVLYTTEQLEAMGQEMADLVKAQLEQEREDNNPDSWKQYTENN